jgi:phosphoglycerate dehydrogenase-like enzyme
MAKYLVAVADSVFPNLDPATQVLSAIGAELQLAADSTPESVMKVAAGADAVLVTYAKINGDMIRQIGAELKLAADSSPESVMKLARDADAVLVTYAKINGDMIREMKKVRIISRFGIGVDNVDLDAATQAGIVVTKVPDYCIDELSDHAMACPVRRRKIPMATDQVHAGTWKMPNFVPIHRLRGSVLGLVGFGRIPQLVAPKAKSFGLRVVAYDPFIPKEVFARAGVEQVDFPELLKISDYVSIHSPLTPETKGLFNRRRLQADEEGQLRGQHRARPDHRRGSAGGGHRFRPHRWRGARRHDQRAARELAPHRQTECDHHAAHQLLFRRITGGAADEGVAGSGERADGQARAQSGQRGGKCEVRRSK